MAGYIRLLRGNPGFARLWLAQVISLLGDWFNTVVLAAIVAAYSGGSGLALSLFLLVRLLPPLVVGPYAGVLVDRFDRKRLLIISDVARTGIVLLLLFATGPERLWLIYVLLIAQFTLSALFEPSRNAIMPALLHSRDELVLANTLGSVTWSVMLAVGAIVGGVVSALVGPVPALITDAVTFLVSALLIVGIRVPPAEETMILRTEERAALAAQRTFAEGLRYLRRHPGIFATIFVKAGLGVGSVDAVIVAYGTTLFVLGDGGEFSMALLWSAFGVGSILGPLLTNLVNDGSVRVMRHLIIAGFVLGVLGWLGFGLASGLLVAMIAAILRAMGGSVNWTYSSVILQKLTDDTFLGRVFSLDMALFQFVTGLSIVLFGLLLDVAKVDVRLPALLTAGITLLPLALWTITTRRLERQESHETAAAPVPVPGD